MLLQKYNLTLLLKYLKIETVICCFFFLSTIISAIEIVIKKLKTQNNARKNEMQKCILTGILINRF